MLYCIKAETLDFVLGDLSKSLSGVLWLNHEICPPVFLLHLYLKCGLPALPKWITTHPYLAKLVLHISELKEDPLETLQPLPGYIALGLLIRNSQWEATMLQC